jgi:3-oxoacyl-[acyl-carrier-protein] synthase-3
VTLWLHALGHFHPETEISNRFLEELDIGTTDQWILERVGIRARRTTLPLDYIRQTRNRDLRAAAEAATHACGDLGAAAARLALARAGLPAREVGLLVGGTSSADFLSPAEGCNVARALGIDVPCFDVNSACTSFLAQLLALSWMDPARLPDWVLVVAMDAMTKSVCYDDRSSAVLWGDGAAAALISPRIPGPARILGTSLDSRPSGADKVVVPRQGHFWQEGRTVQAFAIRQSAQGFERLRAEFSREERALHFVGHQANLRMLENVCRRCGIANEHHHTNVEWYGNTAAPSSASVISMRWEKWTARDDVAVVGVGAGLTWASYLLRFGEAGAAA